MEFKNSKVQLSVGYLSKATTIILLATLSIGLTACGGGGGGGGGTVTNNGTLSNPQNYTMPGGGVATVPPTTN